MSRLYGHMNVVFGGIKLQVRSEDAEAARAILSSQPDPDDDVSSPEGN